MPDLPARTTVVNVRTAPRGSYVYVGRAVRGGYKASPFGNPFKVGRDGTLAQVLAKYRAHVLASPELVALLPGLRGKALGCWCCEGTARSPSPRQCHAQVIAALVDGPLGNAR